MIAPGLDPDILARSESPASLTSPVPEAGGGSIVVIPASGGGDPLVRAYAHAHLATCAMRPFSWAWIAIGLFTSLAGGWIGNRLLHPVPPLSGDRSAIALFLHQQLGNPTGVLLGIAVAAILTSAAGVLLNRSRVPCGQEPLLSALVVIAGYLPLYNDLTCLGVVTSVLAAVSLLTICFRLLALLLGNSPGIHHQTPTMPAAGWPSYTVLVPLYKERNVARNILVNLAALDYPRAALDVKFLLEADDPETLAALSKAGIPSWAEVVIVPLGQPKTKPRACNHGLDRARGDFLVIYDAEDRPEPDQLKQAVAAFASLGPGIVCLQAQLAYHNHRQNLLTRWFALEYNVWFRRYLPGLVRLGVPIPLGGTSNHFRTSILRQVGGWDPFNVTEDCDLGVRLAMHGVGTRTLASTTWEEANSQVGNWIRQRSRWLKGYLITHLVWGRRPLHLLVTLGPWSTVAFLLSVLGVPLLAAINLLVWAIGLIYAVFLSIDLSHGIGLWAALSTRDQRQERWSWQMVFHGPFEDPHLAVLSQIFFVATIGLVVGNLVFILVNLWAGRRPDQRGLWWAALLSPLYWVLISVAAWKGFWQLLVRPHYWEKTVHGLDHPPS